MLQCYKVLFYFSTFLSEPTYNLHAHSHKTKGKKTHNTETKPEDNKTKLNQSIMQEKSNKRQERLKRTTLDE